MALGIRGVGWVFFCSLLVFSWFPDRVGSAGAPFLMVAALLPVILLPVCGWVLKIRLKENLRALQCALLNIGFCLTRPLLRVGPDLSLPPDPNQGADPIYLLVGVFAAVVAGGWAFFLGSENLGTVKEETSAQRAWGARGVLVISLAQILISSGLLFLSLCPMSYRYLSIPISLFVATSGLTIPYVAPFHNRSRQSQGSLPRHRWSLPQVALIIVCVGLMALSTRLPSPAIEVSLVLMGLSVFTLSTAVALKTRI